jgi:hypothetical protein
MSLSYVDDLLFNSHLASARSIEAERECSLKILHMRSMDVMRMWGTHSTRWGTPEFESMVSEARDVYLAARELGEECACPFECESRCTCIDNHDPDCEQCSGEIGELCNCIHDPCFGVYFGFDRI